MASLKIFYSESPLAQPQCLRLSEQETVIFPWKRKLPQKAIDKAFRQVALMDYRTEETFFYIATPFPLPLLYKFSFQDAQI